MRKTVVIVDDDVNIRNLLFAFLSESNFNVISEESGFGLIDLFESFKFKIDVLILDIMIPGLDEAKEYLKKSLVLKDAYMIIITSYNIKNLINEFRMSKSFKLLYKPFSKQTLLETLKEGINQEV